MPAGGWPLPPPDARILLDKLGNDRKFLLQTRGLMAVKVPRPLPQVEISIKWYTEPPDVTRGDLTWYTDGSMRHGHVWELRRTGFAIVVVDHSGTLVAFGIGVPPAHVRTAAAAELWALMVTLMINITPPVVVTDCLAILTAAGTGSAQVIAANRKIGHIWSRIVAILDDDVASLVATRRLIWMPAHGPISAIGRSIKSNSRAVTAVDWRANRLADALAKSAIGHTSACVAAEKLLSRAEALVRHEAALVGVVTRAANAHVIEATCEDGRVTKRTVRDSTGCRRPRQRIAGRATSVAAAEAVAISDARDAEVVHPAEGGQHPILGGHAIRHARAVQRSKVRRAAASARRATDEARLQALCAAKAALLRPASGPPASDRFAALRARVRAREAAAAGP